MAIEAEKLKIEDVLATQGVYVGPTVGVSMLPMLKSRRDTIVVHPKTERLKPLDVALYKRGDAYVLHRVIEPIDGGYLIRGDNTYSDEYIREDAVFGVLVEFYRKKRKEPIPCTDKRYLAYAKRRVKTYKIRRFFVLTKWKIRAFGGKVLRALGLRKKRGE